jgi:hypothetical protein
MLRSKYVACLVQYGARDIVDYRVWWTWVCVKAAYLPAAIKVLVLGKQCRLICEISMKIDM